MSVLPVGPAIQVLVAGPEPPGPWPGIVAGSVSRMSVTPPTTKVTVALAVSVPAVGLVITIRHWPAASVSGPGTPQVVAGRSAKLAPPASTTLKLTCSPFAGTKVPVPGSFFTVTVKVWVSFTGSVSSGAIAIQASTQLFWAVPLFGATPFVERVSETPPTATVVFALITVVPVVAEVSVTSHDPVPPTVRQLAALSAPGPLVIARLIWVQPGRFTWQHPGFPFTGRSGCGRRSPHRCRWPG